MVSEPVEGPRWSEKLRARTKSAFANLCQERWDELGRNSLDHQGLQDCGVNAVLRVDASDVVTTEAVITTRRFGV
jgi:hypothetical protein